MEILVKKIAAFANAISFISMKPKNYTEKKGKENCMPNTSHTRALAI